MIITASMTNLRTVILYNRHGDLDFQITLPMLQQWKLYINITLHIHDNQLAMKKYHCRLQTRAKAHRFRNDSFGPQAHTKCV